MAICTPRPLFPLSCLFTVCSHPHPDNLKEKDALQSNRNRLHKTAYDGGRLPVGIVLVCIRERIAAGRC